MNELPKESDLILVTLMNNITDFEIARLFGWYRIPLRSAPKIISVDYLAFYQTKSFATQKWQIRYLAPVKGHELTTRRELLIEEYNHPRANQEYYKIQIGPLIELPKPIIANKWKRITFFYTTGELLSKAESINDLIIDSEDRPIVWQALREKASINQSYGKAQEDQDMRLDLDPETLSKLLGIDNSI